MWRLHDGLVLPPDTRIAWPSEQIMQSCKDEHEHELYSSDLEEPHEAAGNKTNQATSSGVSDAKATSDTVDEQKPFQQCPQKMSEAESDDAM